MGKPRNVRASDRSLMLMSQRTDFVARKRDITRRKIHNLGLFLLVLVFGIAFIIYKNTVLGILICCVVGSITLALAKQIEQQQTLIFATEFMNALFSSVISTDQVFSLMVRKDGEIMYLDKGAQLLFPDFVEQPMRSLELLLTMHKASDDSRQKLLGMIADGVGGKAVVRLEDGNRKMRDIVVTVEIIERPSGFVLIRGQE